MIGEGADQEGWEEEEGDATKALGEPNYLVGCPFGHAASVEGSLKRTPAELQSDTLAEVVPLKGRPTQHLGSLSLVIGLSISWKCDQDLPIA